MRPYLSIIIPAYREAHRIVNVLDAIESVLAKVAWTAEILVVDDGSPDETVSVVTQYAQRHTLPIRLLQHRHNQGKGAAVRTGMLAAHGEYALFTDADNATPFTEVSKLLAHASTSDVVIGSRYLPGSDVRIRQNMKRRVMSRVGNILFRVLLGLRFADTRCGFKLFSEKARSVIFSRQTLHRWGFDTEILLIATLQGLTVTEVPVVWYDREKGSIHPVRDSLRSLSELAHMTRLRLLGRYR